jgi:putative serine protease PepD
MHISRGALGLSAAAILLVAAGCTSKNNKTAATATNHAASPVAAASTTTGGSAATAASGAAAANNSGSQAVSTNTSGTPGIKLASAATAPQTGGVVSIVQKLTPSVVRVRTEATQTGPFGQIIQGGQAEGTGTGIVIDANGYILTNNHVVTLGGTKVASKISVDLSDGRTLAATLVGREPAADLAVLKVDATGLTAASFADPKNVQVGEPVVAIGYALDLGATPSVTTGVVSALNREIDETLDNGNNNPFQQAQGQVNAVGGAIQTDAAINPGNSGGPLVDMNGDVIGVNTAGIFSQNNQPVEGINFAISVDTIQPVAQALIATGKVNRGFLGVSIVPIDRSTAAAQHLPVSAGVGIQQVQPGSPADQAGLKVGDIITKIGNRTITGLGDLTQATIENAPGSKISVTYYRGTSTTPQTTTVTLGTSPTPTGQ